MQDRRRRTALHLPPPSGPVLLPRERQSSSAGASGAPGGSEGSDGPSGASGSAGASGSGSAGSSGSVGSGGSGGSGDDNPFAPPPADRPDQPWQPRLPENGGSDADRGDRGGWGSQWSSRQPGRSSGGFGSRPGNQGSGQNDRNGPGNGRQDGSEGGRGGLRWDPTDPFQRRARYALLAGMWAFFFSLFDLTEIALLLGALGVYWGISSLRNTSRAPAADGSAASGPGAALRTDAAPARSAPEAPAPATGAAANPNQNRQQKTAAVSGLVTAGLALAIVAVTFSVQLVYRDYFTCVNDSLTQEAKLSCNTHLPDSLRPMYGVKE
ncbi:hypothetical protein [Streptomyces sp. NPDC088261]|uniref:hypothetical protein n=1 Tax=Streptomyces sp. NPDC088261 TaxID=3365851 RepID=UPI003813D4EE